MAGWGPMQVPAGTDASSLPARVSSRLCSATLEAVATLVFCRRLGVPFAMSCSMNGLVTVARKPSAAGHL